MSVFVEKARWFAGLVARNPRKALRSLSVILTRRVQAALARVGAMSGMAGSTYYFLASRAFGAEHQAVLRGKLVFQSADAERQVSSARLRRNTHRLEKGLIMRPQRAVFAEDYIGVTVSDYRKACIGKTLDEGERSWAQDVLALYFATVSSTPRIEKARKTFVSVTAFIETPACVPYPSQARTRSDIPFEKLEALFLERRSTRWFEPRLVPRELLEAAIGAASLAPSACNRQPFNYAVLDEPERAVSIAKLAGGTGGFADNIPCLIVSIGDLSCYPEERDRHCIYIDASLANMQLMLALQTMGLSTCSINWSDEATRDRAIGKALGLAPYERVVMLIAVGYADKDGRIPYSQKKPKQLLIREGNKDRDVA